MAKKKKFKILIKEQGPGYSKTGTPSVSKWAQAAKGVKIRKNPPPGKPPGPAEQNLEKPNAPAPTTQTKKPTYLTPYQRFTAKFPKVKPTTKPSKRAPAPITKPSKRTGEPTVKPTADRTQSIIQQRPVKQPKPAPTPTTPASTPTTPAPTPTAKPSKHGYIRGSNVNYLGHQIEKAGKKASDYEFFRTPFGTVFAQFKGTYKGKAKPIEQPTAQQLNWRPIGPRSKYHQQSQVRENKQKQVTGYKIRILKEGSLGPAKMKVSFPDTPKMWKYDDTTTKTTRAPEPAPTPAEPAPTPAEPAPTPAEPAPTPAESPPSEEFIFDEPMELGPSSDTSKAPPKTTPEPLEPIAPEPTESKFKPVKFYIKRKNPKYEPILTRMPKIKGVKFRSKHRYGTEHMHSYLTSAGEKFPGFYVQHLSRKEGGHLKPHVSHQAGVDADISYPTHGNKWGYPFPYGKKAKDAFINHVDFKRLLAMGEHAAEQGMGMYLVDKSYIERLKKEAQKPIAALKKTLKEEGLSEEDKKAIQKKLTMKQKTYNRLFKGYKRLFRHSPGHKNHIHFRLNSRGWKDKNRDGKVDPE